MKIICIVKKKLSLYFIFASSFMFWKSSIENVVFEKLLRTYTSHCKEYFVAQFQWSLRRRTAALFINVHKNQSLSETSETSGFLFPSLELSEWDSIMALSPTSRDRERDPGA